MLSLAQRLQRSHLSLRPHALHLRSFRSDTGPTPSRRRPKFQKVSMKKADDKSEWWTVDGEMHEIGDNVPHRERFRLPSVNTPNRRRKYLREQFMRRTRLVIKESDQETWCKMYMALYQELRENWEKLYWDEGYSNKHAQDHANYDSAEDDDEDFSPYRRRESNTVQVQGPDLGRTRVRQDDNWNRVNQIRDKFEFDRERRMKENAFAPMTDGASYDRPDTTSRNQPYNRPGMASGNFRYNQPGFGSRNQPGFGSRNQPGFESRNQPGFESRNQPGFESRNQPGFESRNQPLDTQRYIPQAQGDWQSDDDD